MRSKYYLHHGWTLAAAFVIDVGLVGEGEARQRVLDLYRPGVRIHALDDDHWLVILVEPTEIDARSAPGLVLTEHDGRLAGAPGLERSEASEADLAFWHDGSVISMPRSASSLLDPSDWVDVDGLPFERLTPLDLPPIAEVIELTRLLPADLRKVAHIRERSAESKALGEVLAGEVVSRSRPAARSRGTSNLDPGGSFRPMAAIGSFLASLAMLSPIGNEVRRRQARYLERLASQFDGDLDEALRNAIPLGGLGAVAHSLRMPRPRSHLRITRHGLVRSSSIGVPPTAYVALAAMYRRAAERLEVADRIDEAAFVLVELLDSPQEGVAILERHERYELAATVAEDRKLDPALVARLWWLAGDRGRAVTVARRHRVFGSVIDRLQAVDATAAQDLRLEWIDVLERAGDLLGAVEAGWRDPHMRPHLGSLVRRGVTSGGPVGAALAAYRLTLDPSAEEIEETRTSLHAMTPDDDGLVRAFALAFSAVKAELALDREFATLTLRTVLRVRRQRSDHAYSRAYRAIRHRADPILAGDLPASSVEAASRSWLVVPAQPPGLDRILDAVSLPNDLTLVGLGDAGCRLLTPDGRTAARWDVAAHRLVVADHGGSALLVAARGAVAVVVQLDLTTRKSRPYGTIRSRLFADTFDGAIWAVVDERGLAFHDTISEEPRIVWRELEPGWICHRLSRDEHQLAGLVGIPRARSSASHLELWRWALPGITLNSRSPVKLDEPGDEVVLLSDAASIWPVAGAAPKVVEPYSTHTLAIARGAEMILGSQSMVGIVRPTDPRDCQLLIHRSSNQEPSLLASLGSDGIGFRAVGGRVAAWDGTGRLVTADLESGRLITVTRLVGA
jgi:hypothetical protein